MVKETPFLNGNISVYSCVIDVLRDGFWRWHLMSSASFTCVKGSTTLLVLRELLLRIKCIMLSQKTIPGNFAAKILKTRRVKPKNKTKARGELFASGSQVVFAILIPAKLTHIWRTTCLRIAWRISRMHDRKLNGCRQRLPFARHFILRKCSLCSQGSIHADWSDRYDDASQSR